MQRKENPSKGIILPSKKYKIGIVVSRFNSDITDKLLDGALKTLAEYGIDKKSVYVVHVPGSFEIPLACLRLFEKGKYDGLIALGSVVKGETDHYYYIAGEAARGIMEVILEFAKPIAFGLLTTDNLEQAKARAGESGNKGAEAASALLEMLNLG